MQYQWNNQHCHLLIIVVVAIITMHVFIRRGIDHEFQS
jgi:hypothetical protein